MCALALDALPPDAVRALRSRFLQRIRVCWVNSPVVCLSALRSTSGWPCAPTRIMLRWATFTNPLRRMTPLITRAASKRAPQMSGRGMIGPRCWWKWTRTKRLAPSAPELPASNLNAGPLHASRSSNDLHGDAEALETACTEKFTQRRGEMGVLTDDTMPMVDIILDGVLGFEQALLNLHAIEESARSILEAADVQVKNFAIPSQKRRADRPRSLTYAKTSRASSVDLLAKGDPVCRHPERGQRGHHREEYGQCARIRPSALLMNWPTMTQAIADGTFNGHPSPADLTAEETGVNCATCDVRT